MEGKINVDLLNLDKMSQLVKCSQSYEVIFRSTRTLMGQPATLPRLMDDNEQHHHVSSENSCDCSMMCSLAQHILA